MIKSITAWCIFFEALSKQPETEQVEWLRLWLEELNAQAEAGKWEDFSRVIAHTEIRKFDNEDLRRLQNLLRLTSASYSAALDLDSL